MLIYIFVLSLGCLWLVHGERPFKGKKLRDPKYKLPPLVPFPVDKVDLKPSERLTLVLRDVKVYGVDNIQIRDAVFDLKRKHIEIDLYAKSIRIEANYTINGQILVIPISGDGPAVFDFGDGFAKYEFDYDLVNKGDGKAYVSNIRPKIDFSVGKAHYRLDNLFNGNKQLGESTNQILNENPQEVLKDFKEAISETVLAIADKVVSAYLNVIPYEEIFLP